MKDIYAERLLATIMEWDAARVQEEHKRLQLLSTYKYDEYQQFAPGRRFVESLALWLDQFKKEDRETAYQFVCDRLVFVARKEYTHLVKIAYPDVIIPEISNQLAGRKSIPRHLVARISNLDEYKDLQRRSLFLGLSDGARTDELRRYNPIISNEQIWHAYEFSAEKAKDMQGKLEEELGATKSKFQLVWLLDDFSASGKSYIRYDPGKKKYKGKIAKTYEKLLTDNNISKIIDIDSYQVYVIIYLATQKAKDYIESESKEFAESLGFNPPIVYVVQLLGDEVSLQEGGQLDQKFLGLVDRDEYYDHDSFDEHMKVGGTADGKRGFAACSLPVALSHNTPNNSVYILWGPEEFTIHGLFPRVTRHREF